MTGVIASLNASEIHVRPGHIIVHGFELTGAKHEDSRASLPHGSLDFISSLGLQKLAKRAGETSRLDVLKLFQNYRGRGHPLLYFLVPLSAGSGHPFGVEKRYRRGH